MCFSTGGGFRVSFNIAQEGVVDMDASLQLPLPFNKLREAKTRVEGRANEGFQWLNVHCEIVE
jgi:hypothetical protein